MNARIKKKLSKRWGIKKYSIYKTLKEEEMLTVEVLLSMIESRGALYDSFVEATGLPKELLE